MMLWALLKTNRKTTVSDFQGWARSSAFNGKCAESIGDQMGRSQLSVHDLQLRKFNTRAMNSFSLAEA